MLTGIGVNLQYRVAASLTHINRRADPFRSQPVEDFLISAKLVRKFAPIIARQKAAKHWKQDSFVGINCVSGARCVVGDGFAQARPFLIRRRVDFRNEALSGGTHGGVMRVDIQRLSIVPVRRSPRHCPPPGFSLQYVMKIIGRINKFVDKRRNKVRPSRPRAAP